MAIGLPMGAAVYKKGSILDVAAFPTGTVVYLKSGSPPLTVSDFHPNSRPDLVSVEWFVDGEVYRDVFHKDSLTTIKPGVTHAVGSLMKD